MTLLRAEKQSDSGNVSQADQNSSQDFLSNHQSISFIFIFFFYFHSFQSGAEACACLCVCVYRDAYMEVREQHEGVSSFLPFYGSQEENSGRQALQQASLPTEPSHTHSVECRSFIIRLNGALLLHNTGPFW